MNAIKFIQDNGVDKAREVVDGAPDWAIFWITQGEYHISTLSFPNMTDHHSVYLSDLKRLIESVYLVKEHHTIDRAIEYANSAYTAPEIKVCLLGAISDYKSIYGGEHVSGRG